MLTNTESGTESTLATQQWVDLSVGDQGVSTPNLACGLIRFAPAKGCGRLHSMQSVTRMQMGSSMYLQPVSLLYQLQRIFVEVMLHIIVFLTNHVNVSLQHAHQHTGISSFTRH